MRIWTKILIGTLVVVVVLLAGAALFISQMDPNDYRGTLGDVVENFTGRRLQVGGDLRIRLVPGPSLEANDVRFANAPWASQPDMARAERLRAEFAWLPLLKGQVVVRRLVVLEPEVFLETDAQGRGNWEFADIGEPAPELDRDSGVPSDGAAIHLASVDIENARLDYLHGPTSRRVAVDLDQLSFGSLGPGKRVALTVRGNYQDLPLSVIGRLGAPGAILRNEPVEVDLEGVFGDANFTLNGHVGKPLEGKDLNLSVAFETPTTLALVELAGLELEEVGPVNLAFTVREQGGRFDFDDIRMTARPRDTDASLSGSFKNLFLDSAKAKGEPAKVDVEGLIGEARIAVSGDIGKPLEARDLRLKVALDTKATRPLTDLVGVDVEEVGPVELRLTVSEKDGRFDFEDIDATARPRDADVVVKGSVRDVIEAPKPDLAVKLSAKSLRQLDGTLPDSGPVNVSARVRPSGKVIEVRDLVAKIGKSDLAGSATIDTGGERPRANARLQGSLVDLAELTPARKKAESGDAADQPPGGKVFPDTPLPFDVLAKANGDIEIAVDRLVTRKLTLEKVKVAAKLDDGNLTVKPAAHVAGGKIDGTIGIDSRLQPAKFTANVDAKKVSIGALTTQIRGYEASTGLASDLNMTLSGQGDSVRALMAGLEGDIRLEIGEGRLNNEVLDRVGADLLTRIVGVAVPKDEEDETTLLRCGVVRFAIDDGDAVADETLVMETDKVLLKGSGLIDLKTEELDLGANLAAREGIRIGAGTLGSLVRVRGTLAKPELATDLAGVAKTGARVGLAFATGGLSLLAETAYGYVSEDDQPCQTALARTIDAEPGLFRSSTPEETEATSKKTAGAAAEN
jgi:uncharacterized protein involved in outer membrane biogenesis